MKTSRRSAVDPFIVMDVVQAAARAEAAGRHIVHMEIGQPGTPAPDTAHAALAAALPTRPLGYTVALGLPELRAGIARLYDDWYGVDLDPERVIVTAGSSGAFLLAFTALFDAGARVGVSEPGYPSYRQILKALDLLPVGVPTHAEAGHRMAPGDLPAGLDGLIFASPANPTGTILDRAGLSALIDACDAQGTAFISDEIYHGLHFEGRATSALELTDEVYVINSFSKYFCMTGWRIGWMVVPQDHVRSVERLAQNMFICAPHAAQVAALGALQGRAQAEGYRAAYAENRRLLLDGLPRAGFTRLAPPDGAFYIYADVAHLTDDSRALAAEILDGAGVAVTPGLDFDPVRGHRTLRFSYAASTADIREGLTRIAAFMAARAAG
jgi:aspartate/methionine/tyrosine aminotransferase